VLKQQDWKQFVQVHKEKLFASLEKYAQVFEYLFRTDPSLAWKHFDTSQSALLVDIFWHMDTKDLDFDIITSSSYLRELFTARGESKAAKSSAVFEFNVLIHLENRVDATLNFEYICESCKNSYPFAFHRCSSCHNIDTQRVEFSLVKDYHSNLTQESHSFA